LKVKKTKGSVLAVGWVAGGYSRLCSSLTEFRHTPGKYGLWGKIKKKNRWGKMIPQAHFKIHRSPCRHCLLGSASPGLQKST